MTRRGLEVLGWVGLAALVGCGDDIKGAGEPGALVSVAMDSRVGVLLDVLPASMRDRVAADLIARPASFWEARARAQTLMTKLRLAFRGSYYPDSMPAKGQLPLPPDAVWEIKLVGAPARAMVDGHDVVAIDYRFSSVIVTAEDSPGISEPALAKAGGTWDEPFYFPLDPEQVMQRTGLACFDEFGFTPESFDPEEVAVFYDQDCDVELEPSATGCHRTVLPAESCKDAVRNHVGHVETQVHFERLAWDDATASRYRFGEVLNPNGAELHSGSVSKTFPAPKALYRYVPEGSCTIAEKCVGAAGWRRLLEFSSLAWNQGTEPIRVGPITLDDSGKLTGELAEHNVYEFSACHQHYHFMHYGSFSFGEQDNPEGKRGFCLESTDRLSNNEASPIHNEFSTCDYQGIAPGWADNYNAGIMCQWIDVTGVDTSAGPVTKALRENLNPDGFLCEGTPVLDAQGKQAYEPTTFKTADGKPVDRPMCDFAPDYKANDLKSEEFTLTAPGETYISLPCERGQVGPDKNCGFAKQADMLACTPGATVTLSCTVPAGAPAHAVRVCEASHALGVGMACGYPEPGVGALGPENVAIGTAVVEAGAPVTVSFTCPKKRDAVEVGGRYALFAATLVDGDARGAVTCTAL